MESFNTTNMWDLIPLGSPPVLTLLMVDVLGVCMDLPEADTGILFVSSCIQLGLSVPGIVGASIAFKVCCRKPLRSSVSTQAACLAAYDAVFLTTVAVVSVLAICGISEGFAVDVLRVVQQLAGWGATYTILDITAERCFAIAIPLKAHVVCTSCFALKRAAVIFVTGVIFTVPYALDTMFDYSLKPMTISCFQEQPFTTFGLVYKLYMSIILLYLLPFVAIAVVNVALIVSLCRLQRNSAAATPTTDNSGRELSRLVLVLSLWYVVCMLVPSTFFLVRLTSTELLDYEVLLTVAVVADNFVVLDSSLNFVFYFLFWRHFRQEFLATACKRCVPADGTSSGGSFPLTSGTNSHSHSHSQNAHDRS